MRKVIDLETDLPPLPDGSPRHNNPRVEDLQARVGPERTPPRPGHGFDNYANVFPSRREGAPVDIVPMDDFVQRMDDAGVEIGVMRAQNNDATAELVNAYPGRFIGLAYLSPLDGMSAVRELERVVRDGGLGGLSVSSLYNGIHAGDRRYYPLYAKCVELDIPVRIYTAMNYASDRPYDVGHPRYLDQVAREFPELRIVAGLAGWPWADELTALLRRHPNLYADTAAHRPKYFAQPGAGWDQFLHYGNSLNQDKIMVGLSNQLLGGNFKALIEEYEQLPLKESVKDKWLYQNAKEFFRLS